MKKRIFVLVFSCLFLAINSVYSQVGINTEKPYDFTELHIENIVKDSGDTIPKGIMIPRMTEAQRDAINVSDAAKVNSLMIYNMDEDCYNYYSLMDKEWKSVCGALGKAVITFDCADVEVRGSYVEGTEVTGANYLAIKVNVKKPGSYTISGSTNNGYGFFVSGTFMSAGDGQTVHVPAQGVPVKVQVDPVALNCNGAEQTCTPPVTVNVLSAAGTYTISCGNASVKGAYSVGTPLVAASNYIEIPVMVAVKGSWSASTDMVDGISFSGSGEFTAVGPNKITLYGTGTPASTDIKKMTVTTNSQGTVATMCNVNVVVAIPKKTVLQIGSGHFDPGYIAEEGSGARKMLTSSNNFGILETSTVKSYGYDFKTLWGAADQTKINAIKDKPDIIIIGYYFGWGTSVIAKNFIQTLIEYLNAGGVLIVFGQHPDEQDFLRTLYGNPSISSANVDPLPYRYQYPLANMQDDPIVNGPFGDLRGKKWGADCGDARVISNLPSNLVYYSTPDRSGTQIFFRDPNLNFIYNGEGGFLANSLGCTGDGCGVGATLVDAYPFAIDSNHRPIPRTNWGPAAGPKADVYNSQLFANMMAWAINQAEYNGINSGK